jgi:hypothetical protein
VHPNAQQGYWAIFSECTISAIVCFDMVELYAARQLEQFQSWVVVQQDGAPPHGGLLARQFLDAEFPNRWIESDGPTL